MSRSWRIEYEGALYHLLSRGNEGKDIFDDDRDRKTFLKTIGEMSERFAMRVYAYVLMGNHYHLYLGYDNGQTVSSTRLKFAYLYEIYKGERLS